MFVSKVRTSLIISRYNTEWEVDGEKILYAVQSQSNSAQCLDGFFFTSMQFNLGAYSQEFNVYYNF